MSNDGNIVLAAGGTTATVASRTVSLLGAASLTRLVNAATDDGHVVITLPFAVTYNGINYTSIAVGSNGYLTFGGFSDDYSGLGPTDPPIPAILINAGDRSYSRVYGGAENSGATYRIRYEGSDTNSSTVGSPTSVWEMTFTAANPGQFLLDVGVTGSPSSPVSGVSDGVGPSYLATFNPLAGNQGFTINFPTSGGNFQTSGTGYSYTPNVSASWRILLTATDAGTRAIINEVEFRATAGVQESLSGGTASASDTSGTNSASHVVGPNSNPNVYWDSGTPAAPPAWIQYTFAATRTVREYGIRAIDGSGSPSTFSLQYYDGQVWRTTDTRTGVTGYGNATTLQTFAIATTTDGASVLQPYTAAGTGSNPNVINGAAVLLPYDAIGGGGPTGNFGNVQLLPYDAIGTTLTPSNPSNGAVNVGFYDTTNLVYLTPWQLYASLTASIVNSGDGDITIFDTVNPISVSATIDPPLMLEELDVEATALTGEVGDGDLPIPLTLSATGVTGTNTNGDARWQPYDMTGGATGPDGVAVLTAYDLVGVAISGSISTATIITGNYDAGATAFSSTAADGSIALPLYVVAGAASSTAVIKGGVALSAYSAAGNMLAGNIGSADIEIPLIQVGGGAQFNVIGSAIITIPKLSVMGSMTSTASVSAAKFRTVVVNSRTKAVTTYSNMLAESFCEFNGVVLAATPNGIVALMGDTDNNVDIDAHMTSGISELGTPYFKRVIAGYMGYRANGKMKVTLFTDEHREYSYPLAPREQSAIHPTKVKFGRGVEGRYWQWRIDNMFGAQFQVESFAIDVDPLSRRI